MGIRKGWSCFLSLDREEQGLVSAAVNYRLTCIRWLPGEILLLSVFIKDCPHYISAFQIQNNWSYGETLDENAKTHPMLRPYKTFSEKVNSLSL